MFVGIQICRPVDCSSEVNFQVVERHRGPLTDEQMIVTLAEELKNSKT